MPSRAYPGSEYIVANTLAKWKNLEPNGINLSLGLSQKVEWTSCFVFNSLPARGDLLSANNLCKKFMQTVWTQIRPDKMSGLIWIKYVRHPDGIEKIQHPKSRIWHNNKVWRKNISNIGAILENPKAGQNMLFRIYVIFEPPRLYF